VISSRINDARTMGTISGPPASIMSNRLSVGIVASATGYLDEFAERGRESFATSGQKFVGRGF
jgi:hypothetical protein